MFITKPKQGKSFKFYTEKHKKLLEKCSELGLNSYTGKASKDVDAFNLESFEISVKNQDFDKSLSIINNLGKS